MREYVTKTQPVTSRYLVKRSCDLCGRAAKNEDWGAGSYEVNETEIEISIKQREGSSYPESGSGTEYEIDLCPDCFKGRLVPWLREQGAKIEEKEWGF
jgi:hypothetical protein